LRRICATGGVKQKILGATLARMNVDRRIADAVKLAAILVAWAAYLMVSSPAWRSSSRAP